MTASIYPPPAPRPTPTSHAWVDVDLDAVRFNAERLRRRARVPLVAMVKADAYGLGATAVARALGATFRDPGSDSGSGGPLEESGLWGLGIATIAEARALRDAGCASRILCCTPLLPAEFGEALALGVRPSLHTAADIATWADMGGHAWHLSIDTGIARAGVRWDRVTELRDTLQQHAPEGVFTHFYAAEQADGSRQLQERRFAEARATLADVLPPNVLVHLDNSAAIAARTEAPGLGGASLVRPGIALYGACDHAALALRQTVHLRARIVDVRQVHAGESVGYGATWSPTETRRIATVPVGYADGYRRHLSNRGHALVHAQRCPIVGRISMDMTTLDVTDVDCTIGDVVTLIGTDGGQTLTTDAVAERAELSPYELLVGLRLRLPRIYSPASH